MALTWDQAEQKFYETGINKGVLFVKDTTSDKGLYKDPVAWSGLISVTQTPTGAEKTALYADNIKYLNLISAEDFEATIEAYTYPEEFDECDGIKTVDGIKYSAQTRVPFALCYRTKVGRSDNPDFAEKWHFIYNCTASPSERQYSTVNDSPEAITFSWSISTTPETFDVDGISATAYFEFEVKADETAVTKALEKLIYGDTDTTGKLPTPAEIVAAIKAAKEA